MAALTEGKHSGEFIAQHAMGIGFHIDEETILTGNNFVPGKVVSSVTASGKVTEVDLSKSDGTEVVVGIMFAAVNATSADAKGRVVKRGPMLVAGSALSYPAGATQNNIAAINKQLLRLGIKVA